MPEGAIYVGRPGRWGNPYRPSAGFSGDGITIPEITAQSAVALYREHLERQIANFPSVKADIVRELRGHNLCCWCSLASPCHADVLLEIANG